MLVMIFVVVVTGLILGYLANYLADILPFKRRLGTPVCNQCKNEVSWAHFFNLFQPCPNCGRKRSLRSYLTIAIYASLSLWIWFSPHNKDIGFIPGLILLVYFGVVAIIDIEHRVIMHPVSLFGALLGCAFGIWQNGLVRTLAGGAAGFLIMLGFYYLGFLVVKLRARGHPEVGGQEALGFGDVNLGGVLGLILGWPNIFTGLIIGILIAGAVSLVYLLIMIVRRRYSADLAIPYGPFMILGALVLLYLLH
jgi:leader peptidase (prepilin peptidase)/N-methyltransferase